MNKTWLLIILVVITIVGFCYYRKKRMNLVYKELKHNKEVHKVEYFYFWADTFWA